MFYKCIGKVSKCIFPSDGDERILAFLQGGITIRLAALVYKDVASKKCGSAEHTVLRGSRRTSFTIREVLGMLEDGRGGSDDDKSDTNAEDPYCCSVAVSPSRWCAVVPFNPNHPPDSQCNSTGLEIPPGVDTVVAVT